MSGDLARSFACRANLSCQQFAAGDTAALSNIVLIMFLCTLLTNPESHRWHCWAPNQSNAALGLCLFKKKRFWKGTFAPNSVESFKVVSRKSGSLNFTAPFITVDWLWKCNSQNANDSKWDTLSGVNLQNIQRKPAWVEGFQSNSSWAVLFQGVYRLSESIYHRSLNVSCCGQDCCILRKICMEFESWHHIFSRNFLFCFYNSMLTYFGSWKNCYVKNPFNLVDFTVMSLTSGHEWKKSENSCVPE